MCRTAEKSVQKAKKDLFQQKTDTQRLKKEMEDRNYSYIVRERFAGIHHVQVKDLQRAYERLQAAEQHL
eukprot:755237-Heterocapsa_arctica.AAC.1